MTTPFDSANFEAYVPVYDAIPDSWEEARPFLVENLKKMSNGINIRTIGWLLDEELLSGQQFIPGVNTQPNSTPDQVRSVLRKVINTGALVVGLNPGVNHGILFDANFTLVDLWVAGTDSVGFTARDISGNDVLMNATQIVITSPQAFDRSFCVLEFLQEN